MSFNIRHGLFRANITDHHAILGVSLDADPKKIRLQYLRIAQKLHPDTCKSSPQGKKFASKVFSRLVNPAYEELSNKNKYAEHQLVLTQIGKRYAADSDRITIASQSAKKLLQAENNLQKVYEQLLKELSEKQYQKLEKILSKTAVISELNFIYLMLKHQQGLNREDRAIKKHFNKPKTDSKPKTSTAKEAPKQPVKEEVTPESRASSYVRRAKEYLAAKRLNDAIAELRDAIKIDPDNSTAHALMGKAYIMQNQATMAKVHINKAHKANPKDPIVIANKELLDKYLKKQARKSNKSTKSSSKDRDKKKSGDSGFFSSFFGAKKK